MSMIWDTVKNGNRQFTTADLQSILTAIAGITGGGGGSTTPATIADGNAKAPSAAPEAGSNTKLLADILAALGAPAVFGETSPQLVSIPANTASRIVFPSVATKELKFLWYGTTPLFIGVGSVSGTLNAAAGNSSGVIPPSDGITPNPGRIYGKRADGQYVAGSEHWGFSTGAGLLTLIVGQ